MSVTTASWRSHALPRVTEHNQRAFSGWNVSLDNDGHFVDGGYLCSRFSTSIGQAVGQPGYPLIVKSASSFLFCSHGGDFSLFVVAQSDCVDLA